MKNDHKRKAVAIPTATVTARDGEIVVVVPDVLGKNESHKTGRGGRRFTSEQTDAYRQSVRVGASVLIDKGARGWPKPEWATAGAWRLEVVGVWPRKREKVGGREVDFLMPCGDADAAIPQALDALQHAGILDDDARVVEVRAWNLYRKDVRATVMRLTRAWQANDGTLAQRDADIAHLLPLVPPSPAPAPKPVKPRRKKTTS